MTDTLHERLHRLADQVEVSVDSAAGRDLWARGRGYQRARRSGTAVIAVVTVLLVVGIGAVTWQRSATPPAPMPADAPAGLPSRIHEPSPWLPGTEAAGPLGRLVAVMPAERGSWTGSSAGIVGISATTGEYRFVDLPDQSDATEVALAPDGRHLAYWLTGTTTDTPNTNGDYQQVATGVAVYDTLTGDVLRHQVETAHGVTPTFLGWVDANTVVTDYTQDGGGDDDSGMDQSSGEFAPMLWWDLGREPRAFPRGDEAGVYWLGPSVGGRAVGVGEDSDLFIIDDGQQVRRQPSGESLDLRIAPEPAGDRIAAVWAGDGRNPNQVAVARLPRDGGPLDHQLLPRTGRTFQVLGWSDNQHLVVERRSAPPRGGLGMAVFEVDAASGESSELVELPDGSSRVHWATDLLGAPVVDRPEPPTPVDPRVTAGLLLTTLVGAGLALVLWRRRVRP